MSIYLAILLGIYIFIAGMVFASAELVRIIDSGPKSHWSIGVLGSILQGVFWPVTFIAHLIGLIR